DLAHVRKPLRPRHGRHLRLMLEALLRRLERRGHVEDRASVLDRDDAPVAEAPAVAVALHVIDDRRVHVARPQEICVQRMNVPAFDGPARGAERLPEHLAAEYPAAADVAALAAEEIELETLELEEVQEVSEHRIHEAASKSAPRRSAARSDDTRLRRRLARSIEAADRRYFFPRFSLAIRLDVSQRRPPICTMSA